MENLTASKATWNTRDPSKMLFSVGSNVKKNLAVDDIWKREKTLANRCLFCRIVADSINVLHVQGREVYEGWFMALRFYQVVAGSIDKQLNA